MMALREQVMQDKRCRLIKPTAALPRRTGGFLSGKS